MALVNDTIPDYFTARQLLHHFYPVNNTPDHGIDRFRILTIFEKEPTEIGFDGCTPALLLADCWPNYYDFVMFHLDDVFFYNTINPLQAANRPARILVPMQKPAAAFQTRAALFQAALLVGTKWLHPQIAR